MHKILLRGPANGFLEPHRECGRDTDSNEEHIKQVSASSEFRKKIKILIKWMRRFTNQNE